MTQIKNQSAGNLAEHGGRLLVKQLEQFGIKRVFCVPGESYLPVLDALHDSPITTTLCRQEGGAAIAAEAWGKLSDSRRKLPGICFVTRGPGATNASAGVHVAQQDSTPMILFIGQVALKNLGRDAFQEVDYHAFFGGMAKEVFQIEQVDDIPTTLAKAFETALSGRMGPVVIALPEEVLTTHHQCDVVANVLIEKNTISSSDITSFHDLIEKSKNPISIIGGSGWSESAVKDVQNFATRFQLPVACSFRRQMLFDHNHPNYAGDVGLGINPALKARIEDADLVILLGTRMSEVASQDYTLIELAGADTGSKTGKMQKLIHVHPSPNELGKLYHADLGICADMKDFAKCLDNLTVEAESTERGAACKSARDDYENWTAPQASTAQLVQMPHVMTCLAKHAGKNSIMCNGAGNYATWLHRFWRFDGFHTQLAPTSGSMGYGLPASIAGKLKYIERDVICFAGDGCFQMTSQEFGTACQERAAVLVLVIDNGIYGTIRMHQERHFPKRISATTLHNPDFAEIAKAYGAYGDRVDENEAFEPALIEALRFTREENRPALLHIKIDPQAITPNKTLDEISAGS